MKASYRYLIWFLLSISLIFFSVLAFRAVNLYQKRSFVDDSFSVLYKSSENVFFLSFEKGEIVVVPVEKIHVGDRSLAELSLETGFPIRGVLKDMSSGIDFGYEFLSVSDLFEGTIGNNFEYINLNSVDLFKIYQLGLQNEITRLESGDSFENVRNDEIFNRAESIEVVNSTEQSGLAGRVGDVLTKYGFAVVTTSTISEKNQNTRIYLNRDVSEDTIRFLEGVFETKSLRNEDVSNVADIVIVLGSDIL